MSDAFNDIKEYTERQRALNDIVNSASNFIWDGAKNRPPGDLRSMYIDIGLEDLELRIKQRLMELDIGD